MCFDKTFIHVFTQALNSEDTRSYQNRAKIFHLVAWLCLLERDTARLLMSQVFCEADQDKSMGHFVSFICGELDSICDCEQKKAICMGMLACCEMIGCSNVFNQVFEKVVCACVQVTYLCCLLFFNCLLNKFSLWWDIQGCHMVKKSGKTKKNDKSQVKIWVFEKVKKSQENKLKSLQLVKN